MDILYEETPEHVDVKGACDECGMTGGKLRSVEGQFGEYMLCNMCDPER